MLFENAFPNITKNGFFSKKYSKKNHIFALKKAKNSQNQVFSQKNRQIFDAFFRFFSCGKLV